MSTTSDPVPFINPSRAEAPTPWSRDRWERALADPAGLPDAVASVPLSEADAVWLGLQVAGELTETTIEALEARHRHLRPMAAALAALDNRTGGLAAEIADVMEVADVLGARSEAGGARAAAAAASALASGLAAWQRGTDGDTQWVLNAGRPTARRFEVAITNPAISTDRIWEAMVTWAAELDLADTRGLVRTARQAGRVGLIEAMARSGSSLFYQPACELMGDETFRSLVLETDLDEAAQTSWWMEAVRIRIEADQAVDLPMGYAMAAVPWLLQSGITLQRMLELFGADAQDLLAGLLTHTDRTVRLQAISELEAAVEAETDAPSRGLRDRP